MITEYMHVYTPQNFRKNKISTIMVLAGITGRHQSAHRPQGHRTLLPFQLL
jgi:hypothetical protein